MTTSIRHTALALGTALATLASAVLLSSADPAPMVVVDLPRVVVTGQVQPVVAANAMRVVELPRVVITGRRVGSGDSGTAMAQAGRIAASGV